MFPANKLTNQTSAGQRSLTKDMAKQIFVSPLGNDWKVKTVGKDRAAGIFDDKADAVERAREIAINNRLELIVQNRDGQIGWRNSYGNDPRNIKG